MEKPHEVKATEAEVPSTNTNDGLSSSETGTIMVHSIAERDDTILQRIGKKPVLKRNFGFISMLGFSCTVMITWEGELMAFLTIFTNGGSAGSIYAFLIAWIGTLCVFATMGELASMAPTSGGQYHWVSMLAPAKWRTFLSYITGWLTVIGWQSGVAGVGFLSGTLIQGIIAINDLSYMPKPWQGTLLFWAAIAFAVLINTAISGLLPKVEGLVLILHVVGFFAILIPLVVMGPHGSASDVFTVFQNGGGWQTQGLSFMIGIIGSVWNFLGADSAVHMSEEIRNAAIIVPRAMTISIVLNGILGFAMLLAVLFCIGDIESVFSTSSGFPFMAIFQQAVGANGGANTMIAIVIVLAISATISITASASRVTWSFARDRGLPGWKYLSKVDQRTSIPIIAVGLTSTISCLLALVNIGSTAAFNDLISLTINGLYTSYFIGNGLLLWRRLTGKIRIGNESDVGLRNVYSDHLVWGPMRIPEPFGAILNFIGCIFMVVVLFFSFWPTAIHPTPQTMNYSSLMVGTTILFSTVYYFMWAKKVYTGPVIEIS